MDLSLSLRVQRGTLAATTGNDYKVDSHLQCGETAGVI